MTPSLQALKARIETFEHIIAICDDNPLGSRQLIGGELMGMRKALELFQPGIPYVGPGDGTFVDGLNQDPERLTATLAFLTEKNVPGFAAPVEQPESEEDRAPCAPLAKAYPEAAAQCSSVEAAMEAVNDKVAQHIAALSVPTAPKAPTQKERILAAYQDGHVTGADIAKATGIGRGSVDAVLSVLRREGKLASPQAVSVVGSAEVTAKPRVPF